MNREKFISAMKNDELLTRQERSEWILEAVASRDAAETLVIVMEELAELSQQVAKVARGKKDYYGLLEELADVSIVLDYLMQIAEITDVDFSKAYAVKLRREHNRFAGVEE